MRQKDAVRRRERCGVEGEERKGEADKQNTLSADSFPKCQHPWTGSESFQELRIHPSLTAWKQEHK